MDYEEEWAELENFPRCEECDRLQDGITQLAERVRGVGPEGSERDYNKAKMRLTWAIEAQQRHQQEHEGEEVEEEG